MARTLPASMMQGSHRCRFIWCYSNFILNWIEMGGGGLLLKYDPASKATTVLLRDLYFPNGVSISNDGTFLLFCETSLLR